MKKNLLFLLTIVLLIHVYPNAQGYYFRQYQVEDGLSHNTVYCTLQDSKGFMWFGTRDGLNRFDGVNFKIFRADPSDTASIGNNFIHTLFEDNKNQLWVGTSRGLYLYLSDTEKFLKVQTGTAVNVSEIKEDQHGTLWLVIGGKLYSYNEKEKVLTFVPNLPEQFITSLCIDDNNVLWLGYPDSLYEYNVERNTLKGYDVFHSPSSGLVKLITVINDCGNGNLLLGTSNHGLKLFDKTTGAYQNILTRNDDKTTIFVRSLMKINTDDYWVGTESGIFIVNLPSRTFKGLKKSYSNRYSLSDNAIYSFCKDKEGNIWVGTFFGGINYFPKQYTPFQKYFPGSEVESLSGNAVSQICGDQYGNIWIGTEDNGLNKFNPRTNQMVHYLTGGKRGDITHSNIHGLIASGNDLWVSFFEHGLDRIEILTGKVKRHYDIGQSEFKSNFFVCLSNTVSDGLLAGTPGGLLRFDSLKQRFNRAGEVPSDNFIHHIMEDRKGTIWVSTSNGLYYYNNALGTRGNYRYIDSNANSTNNNVVYSSFEDEDGEIWLATESVGLCKLDKDSHTFSRRGNKQKWQSDCVFKILQDNNKNLWMSTTKGLVCYNPLNQFTQWFTRANGLLTDQFNFSSGYKDEKGKMYFGSVKGMISFNPHEFIKKTFIPPVYITSFQINNTEQSVNTKNSPLHQSVIVSPEINLHYNQSSFSFDFAALSYTAPEITEYAYMLEGLDKDWTYIKANRRVYFTNLSPGKYIFKVRASCSSDLWSEPAQLAINISPPFWANKWAYLFYVLLAAAVIYLMIRFFHNRTREKNRIKSVQNQYEKDKDFYQSKIDFFTTVAHEIKTPLTLIRGPLEKIIQKSYANPEVQKSLATMEKNTNRLIQLTNQLLDFRQTEAKGFSLDFVKIDISRIMNESFSNFKSLAEQKDISFSLSSNSDISIYADEEALNKILSNLFSNAIKYADSEVSVTLEQKTHHNITIEFSNDGCIVPPDEKEKIFEPFYRLRGNKKQEGSGIGLTLSRSLTELHGGTLHLNAEITDKNVFVLTIPKKHV